jgi:hypothetical protein
LDRLIAGSERKQQEKEKKARLDGIGSRLDWYVNFVLPFHEANYLTVSVLDYYLSDIGLDLVGGPVCCLKKNHTCMKVCSFWLM